MALPDESGLAVAVYKDYLTPEQAIAATLGSESVDYMLNTIGKLEEENERLRSSCGTLTAEQVREAVWRHGNRRYEDWQAVANELNTELGNGTCEMETDWDYLHDGIPDAPEDTWAYMCSVCGWSFRYDRGIKPNYCPNCGAKVLESKNKENNCETTLKKKE